MVRARRPPHATFAAPARGAALVLAGYLSVRLPVSQRCRRRTAVRRRRSGCTTPPAPPPASTIVVIHTLRHSPATYLLETGVYPPTIQRLPGMVMFAPRCATCIWRIAPDRHDLAARTARPGLSAGAPGRPGRACSTPSARPISLPVRCRAAVPRSGGRSPPAAPQPWAGICKPATPAGGDASPIIRAATATVRNARRGRSEVARCPTPGGAAGALLPPSSSLLL